VLFVGVAIAPGTYTRMQNPAKAPNCTIITMWIDFWGNQDVKDEQNCRGAREGRSDDRKGMAVVNEKSKN
jgi:hypothetical protein